MIKVDHKFKAIVWNKDYENIFSSYQNLYYYANLCFLRCSILWHRQNNDLRQYLTMLHLNISHITAVRTEISFCRLDM